MKRWSYDTANVNVLYGQALAELKKVCVPQVSYEVDGFFDTEMGDTVVVTDEEFGPALYLEARVTEQVRSLTDPARNKTTFDNFHELKSQVDTSLLDKMNQLIREYKVYACVISTDNGIVFKNGEGTTTLAGSFGGTQLTKYRIEQLEKKVEKHNSVVERTFLLEEKMKVANHRIEDLEGKVE